MFLVLLCCCLLGLLLADICLLTRQFLAVRLSSLTVANMSHILPAEPEHERPPCWEALLPRRDDLSTEMLLRQSALQAFFLVTPHNSPCHSWSLSSKDHHVYHMQMLTSKFVHNASLNIVILIRRWVIQSYLARKIQLYQNTDTRREKVEVSSTILASLKKRWKEADLVILLRTSQWILICVYQFVSLC